MMPQRTIIRLVSFGIALCIPLAGAGQTTAVPQTSLPPTLPPPSAPPDAPRDTAARLDGRLFFSAQERQRLDKARERGLVLNDDGNFVEASPAVLNGFVRRSDGTTIVWVDGNVRWNAKSTNADSLLPSDVGGPAEYLKLTSEKSKTLTLTPSARPKRVVKPHAKTAIKPRLLP